MHPSPCWFITPYFARLCHVIIATVKTGLRLVAVFLAATLAHVAAADPEVFVPFITPVSRPVMEGPTITFSLPRYTISPQERETIAACLVLEAASQGESGMRGVMAVIRNRARALPELYAPTVLRSKQFSAMNKVTSGQESLWRAIMRARQDRMWPTALAVVDAALQDKWHDPTAGATHYTRSAERTRWTQQLAMTVRIGAHSFYR
jgi:spore germination cell wall hydrolase CwlJ-like protein